MRSDEALLLDMVIALQKISRFTQGLNETMFLTNDLVQSAVIREFQILGEAARLVSEETKARTPTISLEADYWNAQSLDPRVF